MLAIGHLLCSIQPLTKKIASSKTLICFLIYNALDVTKYFEIHKGCIPVAIPFANLAVRRLDLLAILVALWFKCVKLI